MSFRRKLLVAGLLFGMTVIAAFVIIQHRFMPPPLSVRLLPEGEILVYANLSPIHFFIHSSGTSKPWSSHFGPEYQEFFRQTGFELERDLQEGAVSQRHPFSDPDSQSSAVFVGRFDWDRVMNYLQKISTSTEIYADKKIFSFIHDGNTVRISMLNNDAVAVTNMLSPEPMHSIIDKSRNSALAVQGPFLIEQYYRYVPFNSPAWLIYRAPSQPGAAQAPGGLSFDFLQNTISVVSLQLRFSGPLPLKADVFSENEDAAKHLAESVNTFLVLSRSIAQSLEVAGPDKDVNAVFEGIQVEQQGNRTTFTVSVPPRFLIKGIPAWQTEIQSEKPAPTPKR